jgi:hypothetical protein
MLAVVSLLLGGGVWRALHPSRSELRVSISPAESAIITVDGHRISNNASLLLPPGDHLVAAKAPGFKPVQKNVRLLPDDDAKAVAYTLERDEPPPPVVQAPTQLSPQVPPQQQQKQKPQPALATPRPFLARFESEEPGVSISVDGKAKGTTPQARFEGVVGQRYSYRAKKAGYRVARGSFRSDGDSELTVRVPSLDPEPQHERRQSSSGSSFLAAPAPSGPKTFGQLLCSSNPAGAEVWVDNRDTGRTTPVSKSRPLPLPTGKHTVVFKLDGRKSQGQPVTIEENEDAKLINVPLE